MSMQIADNFSYQGTKPLDARIKYATVADMKAVAESSLYDGCMAYVTGVKKYYTYDSTNTVDSTTGKWREYKSGSGHTVEDASGTAMADQPNLQFKGLNVTNDTTNNATVVDGSGKAKSTAVAPEFDATETYAEGDRVMYQDELYVFNTDHTGAWAAADADKSDVDSEIPDVMTAADLQDVKNAFSGMNKGAPLRMMHYSTEEQVVGTWIDGKPLYQKTIVYQYSSGSITTGDVVSIDTIPNVDKLFTSQRLFVENNKSYDDMFDLMIKNNNIEATIRNGTWMNPQIYATIQYTKTTDTPQ